MVVLRGTVLSGSNSVISADEVAHYVSERFIAEPELWRIHLRTIHGLLELIELTTSQGDDAERSLRKAEYFFFAGLLSVAAALTTFIVEVTL